MTEPSFFRTLLVVSSLALLAACGGGDGDDTSNAAAPVGTGEATSMQAAPPAPGPAPATIADIFPDGPAKQIVLSNCASCHAVACAAIGQRPPNRWEDLESAHSEHVPSLSDEERTTVFTYLAANFSDQQPEPNVPSQFLERGCTPF